MLESLVAESGGTRMEMIIIEEKAPALPGSNSRAKGLRKAHISDEYTVTSSAARTGEINATNRTFLQGEEEFPHFISPLNLCPLESYIFVLGKDSRFPIAFSENDFFSSFPIKDFLSGGRPRSGPGKLLPGVAPPRNKFSPPEDSEGGSGSQKGGSGGWALRPVN